ncbi:MAG: hypothetical protein A4E53_01539 [Pelotomaculum sp. PtaB.Bin104]|nr:MAG: hypothetical protein A4E53_01539 [Pelotomaculum sp. PtaB.Bin104]
MSVAISKETTKTKARILFFKKGSSIYCKVKLFDRYGFTYRRGSRRNIRFNQDHDCKEYPLIVNFNIFYDFLEANKVKDSEVEIDPNSLDVFYGYTDYNGTERYAVKLTKKFVDGWWVADCPHLYRYAVNKDGHINWAGFKLPYFTNNLVETGWNGNYIDPDITEEEARALTQGREELKVCKEIMSVIKSRDITEEQVKELENWINDYEAKIQQAINNNKFTIIWHIADMFEENGEERCFGLDCGFLNIYTENPEYNDKKMLLKNLPYSKSRAQWLNVKMPYESQSLTVMKKEFQKVKEVVKAETGETLYCLTQLD